MVKRELLVVGFFRLPPSLIKRLDAHAARLERITPGMRVSRSAALRMLLAEALERAERGAS